MNYLQDRRVLIAIAVVVILIILGYALGWFGGAETTAPTGAPAITP
jgi:hypothetical protein